MTIIVLIFVAEVFSFTLLKRCRTYLCLKNICLFQLTEKLSQPNTTEPGWLTEMRTLLEGHMFSILPHGQGEDNALFINNDLSIQF